MRFQNTTVSQASNQSGRRKKAQRLKLGFCLTLANLAVVGVGGIAMIGHIANTGQLWNALQRIAAQLTQPA